MKEMGKYNKIIGLFYVISIASLLLFLFFSHDVFLIIGLLTMLIGIINDIIRKIKLKKQTKKDASKLISK